ncbi:hypothetical protein GCM10020000_43230 [Streptomyces olivoverticillatus]
MAPVVEESAKAAAVLLLFLFRRRDFNGIVDGVVIAGITATGFAFTENILYLGNAFASDQSFGYSGLGGDDGGDVLHAGADVAVRASALHVDDGHRLRHSGHTGPPSRRVLRVLVPVAALLTAMVLHGVWNGSASLPGLGFLAVYALFMVPVFGALTWLTIWSRQNELRTISTHLPAYQAAGWITPPEPLALSSMRARGIARDTARRTGGPAAARTVAEYISFATSLAFLRQRAYRGTADQDFTAREQELLHHLWQRREVAQPALASSVATAPRPFAAPVWPGGAGVGNTGPDPGTDARLAAGAGAGALISPPSGLLRPRISDRLPRNTTTL